MEFNWKTKVGLFGIGVICGGLLGYFMSRADVGGGPHKQCHLPGNGCYGDSKYGWPSNDCQKNVLFWKISKCI